MTIRVFVTLPSKARDSRAPSDDPRGLLPRDELAASSDCRRRLPDELSLIDNIN